MARRTLLAIPAALPIAFAAALAQSPNPGGPPAAPLSDYALTNVRIVTAPGKVIERGTVLTHDGRIAAVGATVNIPAGVVRMDLTGHTVYPGLIDAATSIGLPSPTRALPPKPERRCCRRGRWARRAWRRWCGRRGRAVVEAARPLPARQRLRSSSPSSTPTPKRPTCSRPRPTS